MYYVRPPPTCARAAARWVQSVCVCVTVCGRAAQSVAGRGSLGESYATGARAAAAGGCRPDL